MAGAGLAGLTAARDLKALGASVTVVEARDRVGGRAWTIRDGFKDGQHAEGGGDFIDGSQEEIQKLASELGLELTRILRGGWGFVRPDEHGRPRIVRRGVARGWNRLAKQVSEFSEPYRLAERRWESPIVADIGRKSVAQWLNRINADDELRETALGLRGFFLADPDELSLLALVDQFATDDAPVPDKMYRIEGGNDRLAAALAAGLGPAVKLGTEVVAVSQRGRAVRVSLKNGRQVAQLSCDYLVFALPATILRRIPITPALPQQQHDAFARLKYGRATKTLLQFSKRFWRVPGRPRAFGSPLPFGAVWDANEEQRGTPGHSQLHGRRIGERRDARPGHAGRTPGARAIARLARRRTRGADRGAPDRLGRRSVGPRRLRVLRSGVRSEPASVAGAARGPAVLRRRAHEHPVAGLHERRDRKRPSRRGRSRRRPRADREQHAVDSVHFN